jgi:hypothetical protein
MAEEVRNTTDIDRSFDVDFVGSPNRGEGEITTTFTVTETLEIETTNTLDSSANIRYNQL